MENRAEVTELQPGIFQIRGLNGSSHSLRISHTPGHTSGCISIVETTQGLLFSADSVFAGGTLSYIAESGSIGDYIDSLTRLRCFGLQALYPGHGRISMTPIEDIDS